MKLFCSGTILLLLFSIINATHPNCSDFFKSSNRVEYEIYNSEQKCSIDIIECKFLCCYEDNDVQMDCQFARQLYCFFRNCDLPWLQRYNLFGSSDDSSTTDLPTSTQTSDLTSAVSTIRLPRSSRSATGSTTAPHLDGFFTSSLGSTPSATYRVPGSSQMTTGSTTAPLLDEYFASSLSTTPSTTYRDSATGEVRLDTVLTTSPSSNSPATYRDPATGEVQPDGFLTTGLSSNSPAAAAYSSAESERAEMIPVSFTTAMTTDASVIESSTLNIPVTSMSSRLSSISTTRSSLQTTAASLNSFTSEVQPVTDTATLPTSSSPLAPSTSFSSSSSFSSTVSDNTAVSSTHSSLQTTTVPASLNSFTSEVQPVTDTTTLPTFSSPPAPSTSLPIISTTVSSNTAVSSTHSSLKTTDTSFTSAPAASKSVSSSSELSVNSTTASSSVVSPDSSTSSLSQSSVVRSSSYTIHETSAAVTGSVFLSSLLPVSSTSASIPDRSDLTDVSTSKVSETYPPSLAPAPYSEILLPETSTLSTTSSTKSTVPSKISTSSRVGSLAPVLFPKKTPPKQPVSSISYRLRPFGRAYTKFLKTLPQKMSTDETLASSPCNELETCLITSFYLFDELFVLTDFRYMSRSSCIGLLGLCESNLKFRLGLTNGTITIKLERKVESHESEQSVKTSLGTSPDISKPSIKVLTQSSSHVFDSNLFLFFVMVFCVVLIFTGFVYLFASFIRLISVPSAENHLV